MCYEELEVTNERNGHEVLGKIQAHPTHVELVLCGGYLGCVRCGRMTSTNSGCNKLKEACRNHIPKGSEGPVRRLCQGKYPQPQEKSRHLWPNGEEEPIPKRVKRHSWESAFLSWSVAPSWCVECALVLVAMQCFGGKKRVRK